MASIIEAFDSTIKEAFAGIKILIWAVPVAYCYSMFNTFMGQLVASITAVLFIGYLATISNNVIKKEDKILPGMNFLRYGLNGIIGTVVLLPFILLGWGVEYLISNFVKIPDPVWNLTFQVLGVFLSISCVLASYVIYVRRLNPMDAYNMKKYFIGFGEVFMSFSYLTIKLTLWSLVIIGFLVYLFSLFVGFQNIIWTYLMCAFFVFYCVLGANYMAQTSEEIFTFIEKKEQEKKEKEAIDKMETPEK